MPSLAFPLAVNYSIPYWVPPPDDLGIVVARYREVLDPWIDVAANSYVYAKYPTPQEDDSIPHDSFKLYEELPNTGREGRTYCHHIYSHYDDLQPIIIFTQGDPFDHLSPKTNTTQEMVEKGPRTSRARLRPSHNLQP
ncbi:hypothetical protein AWENTII_002170 [Aspergillus wentii]